MLFVIYSIIWISSSSQLLNSHHFFFVSFSLNNISKHCFINYQYYRYSIIFLCIQIQKYWPSPSLWFAMIDILLVTSMFFFFVQFHFYALASHHRNIDVMLVLLCVLSPILSSFWPTKAVDCERFFYIVIVYRFSNYLNLCIVFKILHLIFADIFVSLNWGNFFDYHPNHPKFIIRSCHLFSHCIDPG